MNLDIDSLLINTTIRIETELTGGLKSSGKGFFFGYPLNDDSSMSIPVIVTNKHVIKGALNGYLRFNLADKKGGDILTGSFQNIFIPDFESKWMFHPDKKVDLAVFPIGPLLCELEGKGIHLFHLDLGPSLIPSEKEFKDIMDIEDIIFIGYPDWIYDSYNNRPIVRRGITATSLKMNFRNNPVFLIDAAVYGGSSGSPVFLYSKLAHGTKNAINMGPYVKFVGVVSGVFKHFVNGEIKTQDVPAACCVSGDSYIPNNLGIVIKAQKLSDFEDLLLGKCNV